MSNPVPYAALAFVAALAYFLFGCDYSAPQPLGPEWPREIHDTVALDIDDGIAGHLADRFVGYRVTEIQLLQSSAGDFRLGDDEGVFAVTFERKDAP